MKMKHYYTKKSSRNNRSYTSKSKDNYKKVKVGEQQEEDNNDLENNLISQQKTLRRSMRTHKQTVTFLFWENLAVFFVKAFLVLHLGSYQVSLIPTCTYTILLDQG